MMEEGAIPKEIRSENESSNGPMECFDPHRLATYPSSPSKSMANRINTDAMVILPSRM
jgi:hypothetical protein